MTICRLIAVQAIVGCVAGRKSFLREGCQRQITFVGIVEGLWLESYYSTIPEFGFRALLQQLLAQESPIHWLPGPAEQLHLAKVLRAVVVPEPVGVWDLRELPVADIMKRCPRDANGWLDDEDEASMEVVDFVPGMKYTMAPRRLIADATVVK